MPYKYDLYDTPQPCDDLSKNTTRSLGTGLRRDTTPSPHVRSLTRSGCAKERACITWLRDLGKDGNSGNGLVMLSVECEWWRLNRSGRREIASWQRKAGRPEYSCSQVSVQKRDANPSTSLRAGSGTPGKSPTSANRRQIWATGYAGHRCQRKAAAGHPPEHKRGGCDQASSAQVFRDLTNDAGPFAPCLALWACRSPEPLASRSPAAPSGSSMDSTSYPECDRMAPSAQTLVDC